MQRGEVAVASAYATPTSNQFDETARAKFAAMPQHWTPPPPPRANIQPPTPPPDDQDRQFSQYQYRHSMSMAGTGNKRYNGNNRHKKPRQTCMKFLSGYGCSYGDKCRFSHDLRAFYPELGRHDDPIWSAEHALPRHTHQNYPQRQIPLPPPMPKSDPDKRSLPFHMLPQRERASSFGNHSNFHNNQTDEIPVSYSARDQRFKEAVLRQSKVKLPDHGPAAYKATEGDGYDNEDRHTNQDVMVPENQLPDTATRQFPRRKKNLQMRKCAAGDDVPNPAHIDFAGFCLDPKYLLSEIGDPDLVRTERARQPPQLQQQQFYARSMSAAQLLNSVCPPYSQYMTQGQMHSNLSKQVENFVDFVDTKLASMELHQQQAIDSLQELVRSLWPDAIIDIYGSSYTRLALPASDIDCVLVSRTLAGERPLTILEALAAEVERQPWTKKLELLGSAKIPVLKMTYSLDPTQQDVLLDLTCGHSVGHTGLGARDLIYSFQAEMPALRPLVLILKSHLVSNDLNCAFSGGISSYVLVILVIRFLQACGDTHHKSFASTDDRKMKGGGRRRSYSENTSALELPEEMVYTPSITDTVLQPKWCYTFYRGGRVTWRTGIGSLLILFLETYITFDYRRFGVSIDKEGEYFLLPPDKVTPMQCSAVIPYVSDPIKPGRSICNCFRMHEVTQSWLALYQNLAAGVPVAVCVGNGSSR
ncbi:hypothetical protein PRNP1_004139 [Phytophthora ramorum]